VYDPLDNYTISAYNYIKQYIADWVEEGISIRNCYPKCTQEIQFTNNTLQKATHGQISNQGLIYCIIAAGVILFGVWAFHELINGKDR